MESPNELVIVRTFNAPLAKVWEAWSTPEALMKWWGPANYSSPECRMDFRVGGKYVFCMQGEDGVKLYSGGTYKEIIPMVKIHCSDSFMDAEGNIVPGESYGIPGMPDALDVIISFEELEEGKTKMTLQYIGMPAGEISDMTNAGWNQSFDKLANSLA